MGGGAGPSRAAVRRSHTSSRADVAEGLRGARQLEGGPVSSGPEWPSGARLRAEAAAALREFCRDGQSFAGSRRELAQLMLSPEDVRSGNVIAWLPAGGWPGRLAQAMVIATDLDDKAWADAIRDIIRAQGTRVVSRRPHHQPTDSQAERDRRDSLYLDRGDLEQDVTRDAEQWLKRFQQVIGQNV